MPADRRYGPPPGGERPGDANERILRLGEKSHRPWAAGDNMLTLCGRPMTAVSRVVDPPEVPTCLVCQRILRGQHAPSATIGAARNG